MFRRAILIMAGVAIGVYATPLVASAVDLDQYSPFTEVVGGGVIGCVMLMLVTARKP